MLLTLNELQTRSWFFVVHFEHISGWMNLCYISAIFVSIEVFDCFYAERNRHWWTFFIGECRYADGEKVEYPGDVDVGVNCGSTKELGNYFNLHWEVSKFHIRRRTLISFLTMEHQNIELEVTW